MKILFPIGTLYPSQQGGPSNTVYWMAKALISKNVTVTLTTTLAGAEGKITPNIWLSTNYGRVIYWKTRWDQLPIRMIFSALRQISQHDCVHLNSLFYPPSFIIAAVAIWQNKAVMWSCRGNLDEAALRFSRWKKSPVLWFIRRLIAGRPMITFHATSPAETAQLRHIFGPAIQVVEVPNFLELPDLLLRKKASQPFLLYMGRLHPIKALDNLLDALTLSSCFLLSDFVLKIAGNGDREYIDHLRKRVIVLGLQNKVELLGHIETNHKQELYADAHCLILPSFSENFGNVVIESLAQGTPVIASTGTPWAALPIEHAGFWVKNSPPTLAHAIDQVLSLSAEKYQIYRDNALRFARQRFDVQENIEVWTKVYQDAINDHINLSGFKNTHDSISQP